MKFYYNKATKKKISEADYAALSPDEQKNCREWAERARSNKRSDKQDYDWYNVDEHISEAVGNFAYNIFTGVRASMGLNVANMFKGGSGSSSNQTIPNNSADSIPGILSIRYVPALGDSTSPSSGLNVASRSVYTWVRHQNSGKTNYEAPDLMIYLGAMSSIYSAYHEATRIYDAAMTYLYDNRYIGEGVLVACNVDIADITANIAQFRYGLNLRAAKISSLCVPAKFTLHKRHTYIATRVFADASSTRGQYYMYVAEGHLQFQPTTETTGGSLVEVSSYTNKGRANLAKVADVLGYIDSLLDPVLQDEDMNIMSGDILKAYGRENCYELDFVSEDRTTNVVYNEDVLQQIENSFTYQGSWVEVNSMVNLKYVQTSASNTDTYLQSVVTPQNYVNRLTWTAGQYFFNSHKDKPDFKDNIEWSRDMTCSSWDSELVTGYDLVHYEYLTNGTRKTVVTRFGTVKTVAGTAAESDTYTLVQLSKFDWAPMTYIVVTGVEQGKESYIGTMGDFKVFTIVTEDTVSRIHEASTSGLLGKLTMKAT